MRQTLFRIPLDGPWSLGPLGEVPGLGVGIVLLGLILLASVWIYRHRQELGFNAETYSSIAIWGIFAAFVIAAPYLVRNFYQGKLEAAEKIVQSTAPKTLQFEHAYFARDRAWWALRDYQTAIETYRSDAQIATDSALPSLNLAWLLATCPEERFRDGEQAVKLATAAYAKSGNNSPYVLDVLAVAYAETGDYDNALKWARKAAEAGYKPNKRTSSPRLSEIRKHLQLFSHQQPYRDTTTLHEFPSSLPVYGYGFMLCLGAIAAGWSGIRRAKLVNISDMVIWDLEMWMMVASILGARLFYLTQYHQQAFAGTRTFAEKFQAAINLSSGGLVLYGGVILGLIAYFLFCRKKKLSPLLMGDVIMPSFFLGLAFGRIGCLFNGCCYGDRCALPWKIQFPLGSVPDMAFVERGFVGAAETFSLYLHPSQLYSSINALMLALLTHCYFRYRHRDGAVLAMGLLIYPVTRFIIEYLRGDELGKFNTSLTISQWVSIGLFSFGLAYTSWLTKRPVILWGGSRIKSLSQQTPASR